MKASGRCQKTPAPRIGKSRRQWLTTHSYRGLGACRSAIRPAIFHYAARRAKGREMSDRTDWVLVPRELLEEARNIAMEWTLKGRVPECGPFGQIAQDLDAMLAATPPSAPVGVEDAEVWLFKGTDGAWRTFHNEQHRLDTIADGRWDVRKFTALPQQPAAVDEAMVERALAAYLRRQEDGESLYGCVTAALTAALATTHQEQTT